MASVRRDTALQQICRLFDEGTLAGLPDARLLERYLANRDELAFEALVRRHGSMVLGVCRRVLDDPNDADDAFQAAFLLLARKARSIRDDSSVGGWLHRVAWRIALQVKSDAARRRDQERPRGRADRRGDRAGLMARRHGGGDPPGDRPPARPLPPAGRPLLPRGHDLSAGRRATCAGARRRRGAGWRGAGAAARPADPRGVTLAGGRLAGAPAGRGGPGGAAAGRPSASARHLALGESAAAVSSTTIVLMKQAARGMMIARLKAVAAAALLVAALTGLATALAATGIGGDDRMPAASPQVMKGGPAPAVAAAPARPSKGETMPIRGRVLTPDGKPAAGAEVFVVVNLPRPLTMSVETSRTLGPARTDAEGRFVLELPRKLFDNYCMADLVAYRPGYAAGLHGSIPDEGKEATIRLDREEPVRIRLLDLEGRPASRARFRVAKLWKRKPTLCAIFMTSAPDRPLPGWLGMMIADDQGQLTIPGLARDTEFSLEVLDDRFAVQRVGLREGRVGGVNGAATPTFTLTPAHWLEGRVRLGESGPVAAGAKFLVISHSKPEEDPQGIRIGGRTDAEGRFRVNVPRCESHEVLVYPPEGSPFAFRRVVTAATQGVSQQIDVDLAARGAGQGQGRGVAIGPRGGRGHPRVPAAAGRQSELPGGSGRWFKAATSRRPSPGQMGPSGSASCPARGTSWSRPPSPTTSTSRRATATSRAACRAVRGCIPTACWPWTRRPARRSRRPSPCEAARPCAGACSTRTDGPRTGAEIIGWDGQNPRTAGDGTFELVGLDPAKPVTVYFLDSEESTGPGSRRSPGPTSTGR